MKYDFDKVIERTHTNAVSVEGFRDYLFGEYDKVDFSVPDDDLIKMWVADMEFETAPEILGAIRKRLDHGILGYTMIFDESYHHSLISWIDNRHGYKFQPQHIVSSRGVIPALFYLVKKLCAPKEKALIMTPSYAFFKHAADANETETIYTDLISNQGDFFMNFEDIEAKTADKSVTTLIFCNPHNPTGRVWTVEELRQLGEICFTNGVTIISDEIHCDILRSGVTFTPMQKVFPDSTDIVTCVSASKTFNLAGLLLANVIIPNEELRNQWNNDHLPIENPLSVAAYQAAYSLGQTWLDELTLYLDENFRLVKEFLTKNLPKSKFEIPDSTYLAWIDVSAYITDIDDLTLHFAQNAGILLEGGKMFVANADGYIRLNLACPKSRVLEGLNRISKCLNN
jgi:cystathionine beta-lyase